MAAYDNVSLPGAPDIANAGNFAKQLYSMLSGLPEQYRQGQNFQYEQRQRNLFQDSDNRTLLDTAMQSGNYAPLLQKMIQAQGASAAPLIGQLMSDQAGARVANTINGGGGSQPNLTPTAQTPDMLNRQPGGGQPSLSATGGDNAGAETVRSLTAGIAGGRAIGDSTIANYARALGVDPDTPLSSAQEARARNIIGNNLSRSGSSQSAPPATNDPASAGSSAEVATGNDQRNPIVGAEGGSQVSPPPTRAAGGGSFNDRFGAAYGNPPGARSSPLGTLADADAKDTRARQLHAIAAAIASRNPKGAEQADKAAEALKEQAKQIRDSISKYNEPGRTQRDVESGATLTAERIKTDTERYGKQYDTLQHQLDQAQQMVSTNSVTKSLMDNPSYYSGAGADHILTMQRLAVALGLKPEDYAMANEVFGKTVSSTILDQIRSLGGQGLGQVRVAEINVMKQAAQNRDNTPASNRMLTEMQDRMAKQWIIPIAEHAQEYNNGHLDAGFDRWKTKWINDHPLFSKGELADPRRIAPPLAHTPADLKKIGWKDGDPFRTPDGRILTHLAQ